MKRLTSFFCAMLCSAAMMAQQENVYSIKSGDALMKVDADCGGKVVSLTLDGKELLAQHQPLRAMPGMPPGAMPGMPPGGQMPAGGNRPPMRFENLNDFGSTFWPSPQSEWNWPPIATYDSKPYSVCGSAERNIGEGNSLKLRSGEDEKYPYVFEKEYLPMGDGKYSLTYTIINRGDKPVTVAPWEITRVPSGGEVFFEAPSIRPEGEVAFNQEGGIIRIPFTPERKNRKIFADAKGWLSFKSDGLLFTKRFTDIAHEQAAPGEEEVEIYWNFGTTYIEIENQGAYTTIAPQDSLSWTVVWEISAEQ